MPSLYGSISREGYSLFVRLSPPLSKIIVVASFLGDGATDCAAGAADAAGVDADAAYSRIGKRSLSVFQREPYQERCAACPVPVWVNWVEISSLATAILVTNPELVGAQKGGIWDVFGSPTLFC